MNCQNGHCTADEIVRYLCVRWNDGSISLNEFKAIIDALQQFITSETVVPGVQQSEVTIEPTNEPTHLDTYTTVTCKQCGSTSTDYSIGATNLFKPSTTVGRVEGSEEPYRDENELRHEIQDIKKVLHHLMAKLNNHISSTHLHSESSY